MTRPAPRLLVTILTLGLLAIVGRGLAQGGEQPGVLDGPDCVRVTGQAIYRSGYTHYVRVYNGCSGTAQCQVSTNVDPSPVYSLTVPPGESREQATRIGSPASRFTARATCTVEGQSGGSDSGGGS